MRSVKLGVIGCGVIGSKHIAAATAIDAVELIAIADLRRDLANVLAGQYVIPKVYDEAQALIVQEITDATYQSAQPGEAV